MTENLYVPIIYHFKDGREVELNAKTGRMYYQADQIKWRDFIVSSHELRETPQPGDYIVYEGRRYELSAPNDTNAWWWAEGKLARYIYTKDTGETVHTLTPLEKLVKTQTEEICELKAVVNQIAKQTKEGGGRRMTNTNMNTKRDLFLATMHAVEHIIEATNTLNSIGFKYDAPVSKHLYKSLDTIEDEVNKALNLKRSIGEDTTLSWWMSNYLTDSESVVEVNGKKCVIDTPEKLWDLMVLNKEV